MNSLCFRCEEAGIERYVYPAWRYCPNCGMKLYWNQDGLWRPKKPAAVAKIPAPKPKDVGEISPRDMRIENL